MSDYNAMELMVVVAARSRVRVLIMANGCTA